jgi:RNA polymerase sigma factor (sigma-70 family)
MDAGESEVRSADRKWIQDALERFEVPLLRYAASLTGNAETARDVVQDTFMRLCDQSQEAVEQRLAPWLFRVCRNRALDVQRKENRMTITDTTNLEAHPDAEPSPSERASARDSTRELTGLIELLPPNQREVLRLRFQNQLSYQEISDVTRLTVTNVGFLLHTALKSLREKMRGLEMAGAPRTNRSPSSL